MCRLVLRHVKYLHQPHLHTRDSTERISAELYLVLRLLVVEGHHGSVVLGDRPDLAQVVGDVLQLDIVCGLIALRAKLLIVHLNI